MYLLYKVVFILILLGCISEMLAAPVKLREAVVSDAAENNKAVDEKVREREYLNLIKKDLVRLPVIVSLCYII